MRNTRLGSWESEAGVGNYFLQGYLGQGQEYQEDQIEQQESWDDEGDEVGVTGGSIQTLQQNRQSRDRGPQAQREEYDLSNITAAVLSGRAGSANASRYIPGQFLRQHPYLKNFVRDKKSDLGGFTTITSPGRFRLAMVALALSAAAFWHFNK